VQTNCHDNRLDHIAVGGPNALDKYLVGMSSSPNLRPDSAPRRLGRVRSMLFAPAVRPDFLERLADRGSDLVVIDCEDATPPTAKSQARLNAVEYADKLHSGGQQVAVRVNSPASQWFERDIDQGLSASLAAIVVPKVESIGHLDQVANALSKAGFAELGVLVGIETALGVADARSLLAHHCVTGAYFGAEDFIADMGGVRTESNLEVQMARSAVALAARLAGVPAIDQVVPDFNDRKRFSREADEARSMGYSGKMCIHPNQVELAINGFTPSQAEVDRAQRMVEAYERAKHKGIAAIAFEGQMVDEPLAAQARDVLASAAQEPS